MRNTLLRIGLVFTSIFIASQIFGQGWWKTYDTDTLWQNPQSHQIVPTHSGYVAVGDKTLLLTDIEGGPDTAFLLFSTVFDQMLGNRKLVVLPDSNFAIIAGDGLKKITPQGELIWNNFTPVYNGGGVVILEDNTIIYTGISPLGELLIQKVDFDNSIIWSKEYPTGNNGKWNLQGGHCLAKLSDGGIVLASSQTATTGSLGVRASIAKFAADGTLLWETDLSLNKSSEFTSVFESIDGNIVVAGYYDPVNTNESTKVIIAKVDQSGNEIERIESEFDHNVVPRDMVETLDGAFCLVGMSHIPGELVNGFFMKARFGNPDHFIKIFDDNLFSENFSSLILDQEEQVVILGTIGEIEAHNWQDSTIYISGGTKTLMLKTFLNGELYESNVSGFLNRDVNLNCQVDNMEAGLANWIVKATGVGDFFELTDSAGYFDFNLPYGEYQISFNRSQYWQSCQEFHTFETTEQNDSATISGHLQPLINCPLLTIDLSTPFLRLCFDGYYTANYCNQGTIPAEDATVQITLAEELNYLDATAPLLSQNGQVLTFDIGDVGVNQCGSFRIDFEMECDTTLFGQTLCSEAHIFPDSICGNTWTGANLEIEGSCQNDSVRFNITNLGSDMPQPFEYIVIEDNIILMQGDFQLNGMEVHTESFAAANGATYHMVAAQDPDLPAIYGNPVASASVEGCVGPVNIGVFNQLPFDDGEPWLSTDCSTVIAAYDPNDKTPSPIGWTDEHFIEARTELEYRIRFQNTGTDTAFRVVVVDTLSPFLNPASIRPGASSHAYTFELSGQGVAKFIFENILLPDSTTNEAASHGFVNLKISQKPGNEPGTVIENTAQIYFDFNAPVATNTTFHTIGGPWVDVVSGSVEVFEPGVSVNVFPNPFFENATFELAGYEQDGTLEIFDVNGRLVLSQNFAGGQANVQREALSAGLYFFKMGNADGVLATGKVVVR